MKILIVEDQEMTLEVLKKAILKVFQNISETDLHIAKWYLNAKELIRKNDYDIIFLDHRMPYDDPGCTDDEDFDRFCDTLENVGYGLISEIKYKNTKTIIIGTSSISSEAVQHGTPDYVVRKQNEEEIIATIQEIIV